MHQIRIRRQFLNPASLSICQFIIWLLEYMDKSRIVRDHWEAFTTEKIHPLDSRDVLHHGQCLYIMSTMPSLRIFQLSSPVSQGLKRPSEFYWSSTLAMPTLLVSVATTNSSSWSDLGIGSKWAEIIIAFKVSKVALVVSECTTRPGNDFRHKSGNGADQSAK